ncbi:ABC transporter ATP-binding protein [Saccharibacillus sp. O23]|uniref:ABC transporter ATP-binding protein n=1 Tax=Saccharibacillus sp. O23 TaxID=2009338 RepID=UPI000B4DF26A|nr:ABC transporter ATP-binding protein [Saccharibacillus sp. O23]OWR29892.1 ABC transporter ATP-binding protein [Saccharibacillus sp. O23]
MDIVIERVSKTFEKKVILNNINIRIQSGQIYGLIGPNGAGKTTLTRTILDIYRPTSGAIYVDAVRTSEPEFGEVRKKIGCLMDQLGLYKNLTAWDNLEFFHRIHFPKASRKVRSADIEQCLERVGLSENKNQKINFFSRGMRQRLALARAFINKPSLLILDEPNRGLDVEGSYMLRKYIQRLKQEGLTVFINSHQLEEMKKVCDIYGFLDKGTLVEEGTFEELKNKYKSKLGDNLTLESIYKEVFKFEAEQDLRII